MTVVHALELGVLCGLALFFVLLRLGVIDRCIKWLERS